MSSALGVVGIVLWIVAVILLAAGVTYAVVKLSPSAKNGAADSPPKS
jgi:hypothetical protein